MLSPDQLALLQRLSGQMTGYAYALIHDRDRALDLVQDAILRAMEARRVPVDAPAFRVWFTRIVRNLWIDGFRAERRRAETIVGSAEDLAKDLAEPAARFDTEDLILNRMVVRHAFFDLSADHRDVLALVDIAGFSYDEAAQTLEINRGTVMSRVSRARQQLLGKLGDGQADGQAGGKVVPFPLTRRGGGHG